MSWLLTIRLIYLYSLIIETILVPEIIMTNAETEVLLHPVRIKILTALAEREATPQEIAAGVGDVPKASLYRHINILRAVGAIREVREYRVRGTFEKVYALVTDSGPLAGLGGGGQIADRLRQMIKPDAALETLSATAWRQTVSLSASDAAELQALIGDWLKERGKSGDCIVDIAISVSSREETGELAA